MDNNVVYFALAEGSGRVKIGQTLDMERRFAISTDCPFPIRVLCTLSTNVMSERRVHLALRKYRIHKEWFVASTVILKLADMIFQGGSRAATAVNWLEGKVRPIEIEAEDRQKAIAERKLRDARLRHEQVQRQQWVGCHIPKESKILLEEMAARNRRTMASEVRIAIEERIAKELDGDK